MSEIETYGVVGVFALVIIKELIGLIKWILSRRKNNNGLEKEVRIIGENHLEHIFDEMKTQTGQHNEQIKLLTEIATILRERK